MLGYNPYSSSAEAVELKRNIGSRAGALLPHR